MERTILTPDATLDDAEYVDVLIEAAFDAPVVAMTTEVGPNGDLRCEVTVRRFRDPRLSRVRYAFMVSSDECELRDYPNKAEALSAYRRFIRACMAAGIVWTTSDIPNVAGRAPAAA